MPCQFNHPPASKTASKCEHVLKLGEIVIRRPAVEFIKYNYIVMSLMHS
jgi:hypothetical protein